MISFLNPHQFISTLPVLHWVDSSIFCQLFHIPLMLFNIYWCVFLQERFLFQTCAYFMFPSNIRLKNLSRGVECGILLGTACHFRMLFSKSTSEPYVKIVWNHNLTSPLRNSIHNQNCSLMVRSFLEKENAVVWNIYIGGNYSSPLSSESSESSIYQRRP